MTSRLLAEFGAMTRVAADQRQARNTLIKIQHERREAVLDPDALGKILPAHEVVETFRAVNRAVRADIWDVAHRCEDLSDGVREVRDLYRAVDAEIADRFKALLGRLAMSAQFAHALDLEAQLGALGGEIAGVMRPLVAPLLEKWEWVTGDDEQVHEIARRWRALTEALTQVAHDERGAIDRVAGEWEGLAHTAFDSAVDEVVRDLKEVAGHTSDVADLLDQAAVAVRRAEQVVRDLIRELIEWAAISLAISAAGAIITLGASAAAGAAAAAAKAGIVSARIAAQLGQLALELRRIEFALGIYQVWVKNLGFVQKRLVGAAQGLVVKGLTSLDGDWKPPAVTLAQIRLEPERCFEEPSAGPSW